MSIERAGNAALAAPIASRKTEMDPAGSMPTYPTKASPSVLEYGVGIGFGAMAGVATGFAVGLLGGAIGLGGAGMVFGAAGLGGLAGSVWGAGFAQKNSLKADQAECREATGVGTDQVAAELIRPFDQNGDGAVSIESEHSFEWSWREAYVANKQHELGLGGSFDPWSLTSELNSPNSDANGWFRRADGTEMWSAADADGDGSVRVSELADLLNTANSDDVPGHINAEELAAFQQRYDADWTTADSPDYGWTTQPPGE